jgi:uncharacterized protein (TIGR03083 family)
VADLYETIAAERVRLADTLEGLEPAQWEQPSLCAGWRARDVVVHILMGPEVSTVTFLGLMLRNRFDFNRVNDVIARRDQRPPVELVAALRANAGSRFHPPGFGPEAPLTDITVHSGDILRPLGLPHTVADGAAPVVLDLLVSRKAQNGFGTKGKLGGLHFEATDAEWSAGEGPPVRGPAEPLIMALCGRSLVLDELDGDGVEVLRGRLHR